MEKEERETRLLEKIFNPYNEPVKQSEPNDVDAHWEIIEAILCQS